MTSSERPRATDPETAAMPVTRVAPGPGRGGTAVPEHPAAVPPTEHPEEPRDAAPRGAAADIPRWRRLVAGAPRALDLLTDRGVPELVDRGRRRAHLLFAVVVVLYPVHQLLTRGRLVLGGSMWAETGTNYYALSTSPSLTQRLFGTDAGYIPLPQRLIAFVGQELGLPAPSIPYYYTGAAFLLAGLLIGSLCLPVFRPVIASDGLRFVVALAVALVADFETRTFINFTYFAVVPLAAVTALAASRPRAVVPGWAWVLPLFMLSKPGVIAVLPAMVVVAVLVGGRRFRGITALSVVLAVVQLAQLAVSSSSGTSLLQASDQTAASKLFTAVKYTLGMLGRLAVGPDSTWGVYPWMFAGIAVLAIAAAVLVLTRARSGPLVVIGVSLVAFTMLLDAFSFPASFSRDMALLSTAGFDRRFVVAVLGVFLAGAGLLAALSDSTRVTDVAHGRARAAVRRRAPALAAAVFAVWFAGTGWVGYSALVNRPFGLPVGEVSQWTELSSRLADPTEASLCIPLDPFGWIYGRNCQVLVDDKVIPFVFGWSALPGAPAASAPSDGGAAGAADEDPARVELTLEAPRQVTSGTLVSFALMVKPEPGTTTVRAQAFVESRDGSDSVLAAEATVSPDGGLLQFTDVPSAALEDVVSVRVVFDAPVSVGARDPLAGLQTTIVLWMGQP
jgi:hypothetical protein